MYSGREFAWLYERGDQLAFLDSHVRAFSYIDGVVKRCVYDNLKPAVRRIVDTQRVLSGRFQALVDQYLFEPDMADGRLRLILGGLSKPAKPETIQLLRWQASIIERIAHIEGQVPV